MVATLHTYPVGMRNAQRKAAFVEQHLGILEEARETISVEEELGGANASLGQLQLENKELVAANMGLKESLNKAEKELMQLELKLVNLLN